MQKPKEHFHVKWFFLSQKIILKWTSMACLWEMPNQYAQQLLPLLILPIFVWHNQPQYQQTETGKTCFFVLYFLISCLDFVTYSIDAVRMCSLCAIFFHLVSAGVIDEKLSWMSLQICLSFMLCCDLCTSRNLTPKILLGNVVVTHSFSMHEQF